MSRTISLSELMLAQKFWKSRNVNGLTSAYNTSALNRLSSVPSSARLISRVTDGVSCSGGFATAPKTYAGRARVSFRDKIGRSKCASTMTSTSGSAENFEATASATSAPSQSESDHWPSCTTRTPKYSAATTNVTVTV